MNRKDLLAEALELGLKFNTNISTKNLTNQVNNKKLELSNALNGAEDKIEEIEVEETYEDEMKIERLSSCGNYKTIIIGTKEAARRSNLTEDQVIESLKSSNAVNGWTFKEK